MAKIYTTIENRRKPLWIIGLLLVPFLLVGAVVFGVLQGLMLKNGVLAESWILGSPMLVTAWLFVVIGLLAVFGRRLGTLLGTVSSPADDSRARDSTSTRAAWPSS